MSSAPMNIFSKWVFVMLLAISARLGFAHKRFLQASAER